MKSGLCSPVIGSLKEYQRLLELGRNSAEPESASSTKKPPVKLAILGDHATQQVTTVLRGALRDAGFSPEIYEADFDTGAFETLDRESALYRFAPRWVYLSNCLQKFRDQFYAASPESRETLPAAYVSQLTAQVNALAEAGIQVILNTLALPTERLFGGYSVFTSHSLYGAVLETNRRLVELARSKSGCTVNDIQYLSSQIGTRTLLDERLWTLSRYAYSNKALPEAVLGVERIISASLGNLTKVLVLDLDNTLWGGVIGDDGLEGIALSDLGPGEAFQRFQKYLLALKQRGYVLAVCSKNEEAAARLPFQKHPSMILRESDISVFVANWNDKASNIEFISRTLNLGLDSIIFLDDNPFERGLVADKLPMVKIPELPEDAADWVNYLEGCALFETVTFSADDRERADRYTEEARRSQEELKFGKIDDYLKSLEMQIQSKSFQPMDIARVAQLIQRSNQFNLRTQRVSQVQCEEMMKNSSTYVPLSFSLKDKFGDYGLISVVCAKAESDFLNVHELVMSCRVLKRGVEQFVMDTLAMEAKKRGLKRIRGEYIPSAKNAMVKNFYDEFGFKRSPAQADGTQEYWLMLSDYQPKETFFSEIHHDRN